jgi:anti-sigma factor RsiW
MREHLPTSEMPPGLARGIEAALPRARMPARQWQALAASLLIGAALGGTGIWQFSGAGSGHDPAAAVVDSHIRALMATSPAEVMSSDRHTVKPWFNGRLSQSPRVVDLGAAGFTLVGGRVDVVQRVAIPTLVYKRRGHVISLFAFPGRLSGGARQESSEGYNLVAWEDGETTYRAVSDLNAKELAEFAHEFRAAK